MPLNEHISSRGSLESCSKDSQHRSNSRRFSHEKDVRIDKLRWAKRQQDNAIDAAAIVAEQVIDRGDNEPVHAHILVHTGGELRSIRKVCWRPRPRSIAKTEERMRSSSGDESNRCDAESTETNEGRPSSATRHPHKARIVKFRAAGRVHTNRHDGFTRIKRSRAT